MSDEPEKGKILLYQTEDGVSRIECRLQGETLWLSLNQIADLFGRDKSVISKHLKSIFEDGELSREATVAKYATVQTEGARQVEREIEYYSLEAMKTIAADAEDLKAIEDLEKDLKRKEGKA